MRSPGARSPTWTLRQCERTPSGARAGWPTWRRVRVRLLLEAVPPSGDTGALLTVSVACGVIRALVTTAIVTGVAQLVGFRPHAGVLDWLIVAGIVAAFALALAWLSVALGLVTKSIAGANGSTLPIQFLLPFLSSAFVPADSMPAGIRWFTAHQPFTPVVESLRALLTGAPVWNNVYLPLAWCAAIALVSYLWARAAFRRGTR